MDAHVNERHKCAHTGFIVPVQVYASCIHMCQQILMKFFLGVKVYLMSLSLKFHKDLSFCCGDIFKIIRLLKILNFQRTLHIFPVMHLQSLQRCLITRLFCIVWETRYQNVPIYLTKWHLSQRLGSFLAWAITSNFFTVIMNHPVVIRL